MLSTYIISLREFLEIFLIIGVFLGISKKLGLKREKEILLSSVLGIAISLLLPILMFMVGEKARFIFTEKNAELIEGYLMIFSGFFIGYVIISLHAFWKLNQNKLLHNARQKLKNNVFDLSLFFLIIFFIIREGFEIALFTSTISLFSQFKDNMLGLGAGFITSLVFGVATFFAYIKFPIHKIYKATEYMLILLGAVFIKGGIGELMEVYFDIHLSRIVPLPLKFLPDTSTFAGNVIKNLFGLDQNFSLAKLAIIIFYILLISFLLRKQAASLKMK